MRGWSGWHGATPVWVQRRTRKLGGRVLRRKQGAGCTGANRECLEVSDPKAGLTLSYR